METVRSADGTAIAYDQVGHGPALIIVDGATSTRSGGTKPQLADLLGARFTVLTYDRRGRGDSGDTLVMYGTASPPFMAATATTLSKALPQAELRALDGQDHNVDPAVLAPVLTAFLSA